MEQRELIKELARNIAMHVPERKFMCSCLCALSTDEERVQMIEFLSKHSGLSKTDIDIEILRMIGPRSRQK